MATNIADDNTPYKRLVEQSSTPANPPGGDQIIFIRSSDHKVVRVNASGTVVLVEGGSLAVREVDNSPSGTATEIIFPNGSLTDNGGGSFSFNPTGTSSATFVGARYNSTAAQTITTGAALAIIDFGTSEYDTNSAVTTGASWKFTAPSTGYYHIDTVVQFASATGWNYNERGFLQLFKNNSALVTLDRNDWNNSGATASAMLLNGSVTIKLTAGDYIDIRVAQDSGGNIALSNSAANVWVNIDKVG